MKNKEKSGKDTSSGTVAKAGLWFTVCNFAFRGMAFFTVPLFTRLLTKTEMGNFSNYSSWISILMVITSFDLSTSIIRSKVEHEDDIDSYIWSILSFSTGFTLLLYIFAVINQLAIIKILHMEMKYIHLMFWYFLASPAYSMLLTKQRAFYKYKLFVFLTAVVTISSTVFSIILTKKLEDKLWGRSLGQYGPSIIAGAIIFIYLIYKGKRIKRKYWKYALVICVPLVPHTLSATLLSASDRIVLTRICGSESTAIYAVACSCYHIVTILMNSMNQAWTPWLFEKLKKGSYDEIKSFSTIYIILFTVCAWGTMLIGPELVLLFGGSSYKESVYSLTPLMTSCIFQFIYLMYVNVEFYTKKTTGVAVATMVSAGINICMNYLFVSLFPDKGYIVVSYTTLVGYFILLVLHYGLVRKLKMTHVYNTQIFIVVVLSAMILMFIINMLYRLTVFRYILFAFYCSGLMVAFLKNKNSFIRIMQRK